MGIYSALTEISVKTTTDFSVSWIKPKVVPASCHLHVRIRREWAICFKNLHTLSLAWLSISSTVDEC